MSKGDYIAAGGRALVGLGAAFGIYRELGEHGIRIETSEKNQVEIKSDLKEVASELREFRAEWRPAIREE